MKKLLALVLCVVILASISVSAFAAVDLTPAYNARTNLYDAYGNLAGAIVYANTVVGIRNLLNDPTWNQLNAANFQRGAVSYEGLWALVAPDIYNAYETAGDTFATAVGVGITAVATVVNAAATAIINGI